MSLLSQYPPLVPNPELLGFGEHGPNTAAYYTLGDWSTAVEDHPEEFEHGEEGSTKLVRRRNAPNRVYWWRLYETAEGLRVIVQPYEPNDSAEWFG